MRDTVQSIGIAVVLAFVLRAFLIEAFVIPTGSMAPRLMGEHWRLQCPVCGFEYDYGWTAMSGQPSGRRKSHPSNATCPNCNHNYKASDGSATWVAGGDRVLVLKYLNNFRDPQPWDVVVFRNPQNNRENYIKRLIGVPGETIEIIHGNVWVKLDDDSPWTIRHKPPNVQEVMWQIVHDNDYQPFIPAVQPTGQVNYPQARPPDPSIIPWWTDPRRSGMWDTTGNQNRLFAFKGSAPAGLLFGGPDENSSVRIDRSFTFLPSYGYNSIGNEANPRSNPHYRSEVCTDLRLSFVYRPQAADSRVVLLLDAMAKGYAAEVSADGTVRLLHRPGAAAAILAAGNPAELTEATGWTTWQEGKLPPLEVGRGHELAITNVDYHLTLWVNGKAVLESDSTQYPADHDASAAAMQKVLDGRDRIPTPQVAIAAAGGPCQLLHVRLERDVYYTFTNLDLRRGPRWQYARSLEGDASPEASPLGWGMLGRPIRLRGDKSAPNSLDAFFVLGDNSPQSHDSRRWTLAAPTLRLFQDGEAVYQLGTVPRYNMIGKAVFVYWPSGFRLPHISDLPLVPNVGSMRRVR